MINIAQIEAAINHWRASSPSKAEDGHAISQEVNALAEIYGEMIASHTKEISEDRLTDMQKSCLAPIVASTQQHDGSTGDASECNEEAPSAPAP